MGTKVFISSTIYDLIDVRCEVESEIREMGLIPIMSDSVLSEFAIMPDRNSIETCLANVRNCDLFIIILSQRYGPSLKDVGYADFSATHYEYLEAARAKKPIYMYVRDRLEADYNIWKKNNEKEQQEFAWIKSGDQKIFSLLKSHRKLSEKTVSNWIWIFRNSIELKERVKKDLSIPSGKAKIKTLSKNNAIAMLLPTKLTLTSKYNPNWSKEIADSAAAGGNMDRETAYLIARDRISLEDFWCTTNLKFSIKNLGSTAAINPSWSFLINDHELYNDIIPSLSNNGEIEISTTIEIPQHVFEKEQHFLEIRASYTIPEGLKVIDLSKCKAKFDHKDLNVMLNYCGKQFIASDVFAILPKD